MMFYPTNVHAEEEDTAAVPVGTALLSSTTTTIMGHRAPKKMMRTTGRSVGRVMTLVACLLLLLVAEGAVVMLEEKEEGAWSDAGSTTRSAAAAATAAEEGVVMTEDGQETTSSRRYDFAAAGEDLMTEDGSRIHELTPRQATADAAAVAAATTQRRRKIAKGGGSGSTGGSDCAKSTKYCPSQSRLGYRIIMAASGKTFTDASCPVASPKNDYWLHWSDEEYNRPHSTITKKVGYGIKGSSSLTLSTIDKEIKKIANGKYAGSKRYEISKNKYLKLDVLSSITIAKYNSTSVNEVSRQVFDHLNPPTGMQLQYQHSPNLHFTLGYNNNYTNTEFNDLAQCIRGQYMDLVVQNIDNRCWCKIHSLKNRKKSPKNE